jgi:hypothetical protein
MQKNVPNKIKLKQNDIIFLQKNNYRMINGSFNSQINKVKVYFKE